MVPALLVVLQELLAGGAAWIGTPDIKAIVHVIYYTASLYTCCLHTETIALLTVKYKS